MIPLAPTLVGEPPAGDSWLHEIKHDGFRTQLIVADGRARAFSRRGHDWSGRYPRIVAAAAALPCNSAIIDGEAIVQDASGRSSIELFYEDMHGATGKAHFLAFDLLHLDGEDLRKLPLEHRRAVLRQRIEPDPLSGIQFSDALVGPGADIFQAAERMGLEGIVSKRLGSRYKSGPSRDWLKTKCMTEGEFVVVGAAPNPGGAPFALLARETEGGLTYAGSAFVTLKDSERERFWCTVEKLKIAKPVVTGIGSRKAGYCRPELKVRARHLRGEADAASRQPDEGDRMNNPADDILQRLIARREELKGIRGTPKDGEPASEIEHFYLCSRCGQAVDKRVAKPDAL